MQREIVEIVKAMLERWFLARKHMPPGQKTSAASLADEASITPMQLMVGGPLDALGQQNESIRDRVNRMVERLDELRSLSADFGLIVGPLNDFIGQHAASRARLMEVEALLARERDLATTVRSDFATLQVSSARIFGDLQDALATLTDREETVRRQDLKITELRIRVTDLKSHSDNLDGRLFAEADRAKALAEDNAALRSELAAAEEARAMNERSLSESRETLGLTEAEASRLQALVESMSLKIAGLNRTLADLEPQLQVARSTTTLVQGKYAAEQAARQKSEATRDAERATYEMEIEAQAMKIAGLNAHVVNTDKLIAHLRDQLRDKAEAFRVAEKASRDAIAERLSLERRLETAVETSARTAAQLGDVQRASLEAGDRADMLTKAVAAKDQAIETANRKTTTLLDRIESINARFALERSEFETTHRRTIEELQNERAERSLAHGALDIARRSRASLLAQYTELKRRTGATDPRVPEEASGLEVGRVTESNVMAFAPPEAGA